MVGEQSSIFSSTSGMRQGDKYDCCIVQEELRKKKYLHSRFSDFRGRELEWRLDSSLGYGRHQKEPSWDQDWPLGATAQIQRGSFSGSLSSMRGPGRELTEEKQFVKLGVKDLLLNSCPWPLFIRLEPQKGFFQAGQVLYFRHFILPLGKSSWRRMWGSLSNSVFRVSNRPA